MTFRVSRILRPDMTLSAWGRSLTLQSESSNTLTTGDVRWSHRASEFSTGKLQFILLQFVNGERHLSHIIRGDNPFERHIYLLWLDGVVHYKCPAPELIGFGIPVGEFVAIKLDGDSRTVSSFESRPAALQGRFLG